MATTFVEAIGSYLQTQALGTLGTDLFIGLLPAAPDACVALYEGDSDLPIVTAGATAIAIEIIDLRVVVRVGRDDYATGRDKALAIRTALAGITEQTLSGVRVLRCASLGWLLAAGNDESDRPHFTVRFRAHVAP